MAKRTLVHATAITVLLEILAYAEFVLDIRVQERAVLVVVPAGPLQVVNADFLFGLVFIWLDVDRVLNVQNLIDALLAESLVVD